MPHLIERLPLGFTQRQRDRAKAKAKAERVKTAVGQLIGCAAIAAIILAAILSAID